MLYLIFLLFASAPSNETPVWRDGDDIPPKAEQHRIASREHGC